MLNRALFVVLVFGVAFSLSGPALCLAGESNLRPVVLSAMAESSSWGPFAYEDKTQAADACASSCSDGSSHAADLWPTVRVGETVFWDIAGENLGENVSEACMLRVSWRRQDKQSECGFAEVEIPPIAPGRTTGSAPFEPARVYLDTADLAPGCYIVTVFIDSESVVPEIREDDNRVSVCMIVEPGLPNLHPKALILRPTSPVETGETLVASVEIENNGTAAAGQFTVVLWHAAGPEMGGSPLCLTSSTVPACGENPDLCLGTIRVDGLDRDRSIVVSIPFNSRSIDADIDDEQGRTYTLQAQIVPAQVLDGSGTPLFREEYDSDNSIATSITVRPNLRQLPDLRPTSLSISPQSPLAHGSETIATVGVENVGGSRTTAQVAIRLEYRERGSSKWHDFQLRCGSDGTECNENVDTISTGTALDIEEGVSSALVQLRLRFDNVVSGGAASGTTGRSLEPGEYELRAVVDPLGAENERDENNNVIVIGFTIQGAELHPLGLTLSSSSVVQGDDVAVSVPIENSGTKSESFVTVGFYVDGTRMDTFYYAANGTGDLGTDERFSARGYVDTTDLPVGEHVLRAVVDPDNEIPEVDDANNEVSVRFYVDGPQPRRPELVVEEAEIPRVATIGGAVSGRLSCTVANRGNLPAEGISVGLKAFLTGGDLACADAPETAAMARFVQRIDRLEPGERAVIVWDSFISAPGVCRFCFTVDETGEIEEMDENNNSLILGVAGSYTGGGGPQPDLRCQLTVIPQEAELGGTVAVVSAVLNAGSEAAGPSRAWLRLQDSTGGYVTLGEYEVPGLAGGSTVDLGERSFPAPERPGVYTAILMVDTQDSVMELSESNNECRQNILIGIADPFSNLVVSDVRLSPRCSPSCSPYAAKVEIGQRLLALVTVRNEGTVAVGPFAVSFETSDANGTIVDNQRTAWPGLDAMAEAQISHPIETASSGALTVSVAVDSENAIVETSEVDNGGEASFFVEPLPETTANLLLERDGQTVLYVVADPASHRLHSVWSDGQIHSTDLNGQTDLTYDAGGAIGAFASSMEGTRREALVAVDDRVHRVDLAAGTAVVMGEGLGAAIVDLAFGKGMQVMAATTDGIHLLAGDLTMLAQTNLPETVRGIEYDDARETLYAITAAGLYALDEDLQLLCDVKTFTGSPTAIALGPIGVFVGTSSGHVYAKSFCMSHGGSPSLIVDSWRYPQSGSLAGAVTAMVVGPGGYDPVYVAASGVTALTYGGTLLWTYPDDDTSIEIITSGVAVEGRSGRVFFVDGQGKSHILDSTGDTALEPRAMGDIVGASLTVALDEYRTQTDLGLRLVRAYYYGLGDSVFRIESDR